MTQYKKNSLVTSMASHTSGLLQIFLILPLQSPLHASSCSFSKDEVNKLVPLNKDSK